MGIVRYFVKKPLIAILASILLAVAGITSVIQLKRSTFPAVDFLVFTLNTPYYGASPDEIEINVTNKIEDKLKSIEGIDRTISWSSENHSGVVVWIDLDYPDPDEVKKNILSAVERISDFPEGVGKTFIDEFKTSNLPVIGVGVTGGKERERRRISKVIEDKIRNIKGVSNVTMEGHRAREIKIEVDLKKLKEKNLSLIEIADTLKRRNIKVSSGDYKRSGKTKKIVTFSEFRNVEEIKNLAIRSNFTGRGTLLKDVAKVNDDYEDPKILVRSEGKPSIQIKVRSHGRADIINVSHSIQKMIKNFNKQKTSGEVKLSITMETSQYTERMLNITKNNGYLGLGLVFVTLLIFLTTRVAIWTTIGLPVAIFGAMSLFRFFDININIMTLISMILVLGLLVDDALVVAENITRHREMGKNRLNASLDGVREMFWPVTTTVVTTILSFTPMFYLSGDLGEMVKVVPMVVILTLSISLFECICLLPAHIGRRKGNNNEEDPEAKEPKWWTKIKTSYQKFLEKILKHKFLILLLFFGLLSSSLLLFQKKMKIVLFPTQDANQIAVVGHFPRGTAIQTTMEKMHAVEKKLKEITGKALNTSYALAGHANWNIYSGVSEGGNDHDGMVTLNLKHSSLRKKTSETVLKEIQDLLPELKKKYGFNRLYAFINTGAPGSGRSVSITLVSKNDELRNKMAEEVYDFFDNMKGIKNLDKDFREGKTQVRVIPDYDKIYRLGVSPDVIASGLGIVFGGLNTTKIYKDGEDIKLKLGVNKEDFQDEKEIFSYIQIPNKRGSLLDLETFIKTESVKGYDYIIHFKGSRATTITADTENKIMTSLEANKLFREKFKRRIDENPEISMEIGGEDKSTKRSIEDFQMAVPFAILCVYFVLVLLFDSMTQPLIILAAIPFAIAGVIYTFFFWGMDISFFAGIGLLGLIGIVVNDSLIMVSHLNNLSSDKELTLDIIVQGSTDRLRAVILTTITTVAGMTPTIFGFGGSEPYLIPLVLAVVGGLVFATIITLVLVPTLYSFRIKTAKKAS